MTEPMSDKRLEYIRARAEGGLSIPPTTVLELLAEIETLRSQPRAWYRGDKFTLSKVLGLSNFYPTDATVDTIYEVCSERASQDRDGVYFHDDADDLHFVPYTIMVRVEDES